MKAGKAAGRHRTGDGRPAAGSRGKQAPIGGCRPAFEYHSCASVRAIHWVLDPAPTSELAKIDPALVRQLEPDAPGQIFLVLTRN